MTKWLIAARLSNTQASFCLWLTQEKPNSHQSILFMIVLSEGFFYNSSVILEIPDFHNFAQYLGYVVCVIFIYYEIKRKSCFR